MTTESKQVPPSGGTAVLLRSGSVALTAVLVFAAVAAVVAGSAAGSGALVGGGVALVVFVSGSLVVNAVAGMMPSMSLVFALSTYVLQLLVLGVFFTAVDDADPSGTTLAADWLGAAVITVTVIWLGVQILFTSRARIPVYDLPSQAVER